MVVVGALTGRQRRSRMLLALALACLDVCCMLCLQAHSIRLVGWPVQSTSCLHDFVTFDHILSMSAICVGLQCLHMSCLRTSTRCIYCALRQTDFALYRPCLASKFPDTCDSRPDLVRLHQASANFALFLSASLPCRTTKLRLQVCLAEHPRFVKLVQP